MQRSRRDLGPAIQPRCSNSSGSSWLPSSPPSPLTPIAGASRMVVANDGKGSNYSQDQRYLLAVSISPPCRSVGGSHGLGIDRANPINEGMERYLVIVRLTIDIQHAALSVDESPHMSV